MSDMVYQVHVSAETLHTMRRRLHEYQDEFAKRFGVTRRTVIRWEQRGTHFAWWQDKAKAWRKLAKKFPDILKPAERRELYSSR